MSLTGWIIVSGAYDIRAWNVKFWGVATGLLSGLGYLPASVANFIATLEPVFTMLLAFLLLGESLERIQLIGSGLIISSVIEGRKIDPTPSI